VLRTWNHFSSLSVHSVQISYGVLDTGSFLGFYWIIGMRDSSDNSCLYWISGHNALDSPPTKLLPYSNRPFDDSKRILRS